MSNSRFECKQFSVAQNIQVFKITTDSMAIGALANSHDTSEVLEIGTGTGIITLMIAQRFAQSRITAIDNNIAASELAYENFKYSNWSDRLTSLHIDLKNFIKINAQLFDLVISNPPYYPQGPLPVKDHLKHAKHDLSGLPIEIIKASNNLLTPKGKLFLILPTYRYEQIIEAAKTSNLHIAEEHYILPTPDKEANRVILGFSLEPSDYIKMSTITVYDYDRNYHPSWSSLLQDFMTIF